MNTNKILMGLILPAIIGASAAFAQQPTMDKLKFSINNGRYAYAMAADNNTSGAVVIPATYNGLPVTKVALFAGRKGITSVTLPNSLTEIDQNAFVGCTGIKSITIPASVTKIGSAFDTCTNLTSVTFEGSAATLSSYNARAKAFPGDLDTKYQAGGAGTYTRSAGSNTWTKQGDTKICPCCGRPL